MSNIKVSIVITTRNRQNDLTRCIESIVSSNLYDINLEIIVVDDSSTDDTVNSVAKKFSGIESLVLVSNKTQQMMVKSRNIGGKLAKGELVLFVDDDNEVCPSMVMRLVEASDSYSDYGIFGPTMHFFSNKKSYLNFQKINFYTGKTTGGISHDHSEIIDSDGIPNVFMVRKKVLELCNYFDESIVQTFTEPDLAFHAKKIGYKCGIVKAASTYHKIPVKMAAITLGGNMHIQKAYFLMRNRTVLVVRYGTFFQQFIYLTCFSFVWPFLYSVAVLRESRFDLIRLYWLGFYDGLRYFFKRELPNSQFVIERILKLINKSKV